MLKKVLIAFGILVIVLIVVGGYFYHSYFKTPLPQEAGLKFRALNAEVEIDRDGFGTPHIKAKNNADLFFAIGYAQAQDRLFQMDLNRRVGRGRLSELFGRKALSVDRFIRTVGLSDMEEREAPHADAEIPELIQAYVQGVNHYIREAVAQDKLPVEYRLLKTEPELWQAADTRAAGNYLAWSLAYNYSSELIMASVADKVGIEKIGDLLPFYPDSQPVHIDREIMGTARNVARRMKPLFAWLPALGGGQGGSNAWVVARSRSASGSPLLAADPHLQAGRIPGVFYAIHISTPEVEAYGVTMPGQPFILIGRNDRLAWGITNNGADVQDLFAFKRNPHQTLEYEFEGQWRPLETTTHQIKVKESSQPGGFYTDTLIVYHTLRGPVISDPLKDETLLSLHWIGHEFLFDFSAFWLFCKARDWKDFRSAAMTYNGTPQNLVYADREGHIAYRVMGSIPQRNPDIEWNSFLPVDGGDPAFQWQGMRPAEELPEMIDPPQGFIVSANQPTYRADDPRYFPQKTDPGFRAKRIAQMIQTKEKHDLQSFAQMQSDSYSILAAELIDRWSKELALHSDLPGQQFLPLLRKGAGDDQALYLYHLLRRRFAFNTLRDELGDSLATVYLGDWYLSLRPWLDILSQRKAWLDDVSTPQQETYADILLRSWQEVTDFLQQRRPEVSWKLAHRLPFKHPFSKASALLAYFLDAPPRAMGGDGETVNRAGFAFKPGLDAPFDVAFVAAFRQVVDLAHPEHALGILQTGSSG